MNLSQNGFNFTSHAVFALVQLSPNRCPIAMKLQGITAFRCPYWISCLSSGHISEIVNCWRVHEVKFYMKLREVIPSSMLRHSNHWKSNNGSPTFYQCWRNQWNLAVTSEVYRLVTHLFFASVWDSLCDIIMSTFYTVPSYKYLCDSINSENSTPT